MARHLKMLMPLESPGNRAPREMTVEYRTRLTRYFNLSIPLPLKSKHSNLVSYSGGMEAVDSELSNEAHQVCRA